MESALRRGRRVCRDYARQVYHLWQNNAGGAWSEVYAMGIGVAHALAAVTNSDGRIELFYIGDDQQIWHLWQNTAGGAFSDAIHLVSATLNVHAITAAVGSDNKLNVFAVDDSAQIRHITQSVVGGAWSTAIPIRASGPAFGVAAARNSDGRLELFHIGQEGGVGNIYHQWQNSASSSNWNSPVAITQGYARELAAVTNQGGRMELFFIEVTGDIQHRWQDSAAPHGWSDPISMGFGSAYALGVGINQDGRLELFDVN
jgi:hypothetical protein